MRDVRGVRLILYDINLTEFFLWHQQFYVDAVSVSLMDIAEVVAASIRYRIYFSISRELSRSALCFAYIA